MTSDYLHIVVAFAFIIFTVIITKGTASFDCLETNDSTKEKKNNE
jgi:hypothetical protein